MEITDEQITEYIQHCRFHKSLDEKTLKAYRIDLKQYYEFFEIFSIGFTREGVSNFLMFLHGNFKPKTVKRKIASIKAFLNYCEDEDLLEENPFRRMKIKYNEPFVLPKTIPVKDLTKLLNAAYHSSNSIKSTIYKEHMGLRDVAILELLFATGMRVSELCSLSVGDIDAGEWVVKIMGKGAKERIIQLTNQSVIDAVVRYMDNCIQRTGTATPLFTNRNGDRISEQSVRRIINKYSNIAGITAHFTPHMFRHTFATLLLEEDVDIRYIQRLLGHSTITTTQIYTHVSSAKQRSILEVKHPRNKICIQ